MRKLYKLLIPIFLISIFSISLCSYESGVFLKVPISPAASGMGDSFVSLSNDAFGMYYNPAGIGFIKNPVLSFAHHIYVQDINGDSLGFVYPFKNLVIGYAPTFFYMKEEPIYDSFGNTTGGNFGYDSTIVPITIAIPFGNLSIGSSLKYYSETIYKETEKTTIFDLGGIYKAGDFRFGFALQNLGGKLYDYDIIKIQRYGAAYTQSNYTLSADIEKEGEAKNSINVGAEINLANVFKLRGGYRFKEDFGGMTFGIGFKLGNLSFDYSFLDYGDLGNTHKAGISYQFGKAKPKEVKEEKPVEKN